MQNGFCTSTSDAMDKRIDKAFARVMSEMERALAVAFVFAVALNFVNVVGRYGFGLLLMGADEVQIYIMVCMTFLGASLVTWRKQHLRMDVLVRFFPGWFQLLLKAVELLLFLALSVFVMVQSSRYAAQMFILDRRSDNAGIPMWIPHGAVAVGFGLMALIVMWHAVRFARNVRKPRSPSASMDEETNP